MLSQVNCTLFRLGFRVEGLGFGVHAVTGEIHTRFVVDAGCIFSFSCSNPCAGNFPSFSTLRFLSGAQTMSIAHFYT